MQIYTHTCVSILLMFFISQKLSPVNSLISKAWKNIHQHKPQINIVICSAFKYVSFEVSRLLYFTKTIKNKQLTNVNNTVNIEILYKMNLNKWTSGEELDADKDSQRDRNEEY